MSIWTSKAKGIDISHYQQVDWDIIKNQAKLDFVAAKCSEGNYYQDADFANNVDQVYKLDLPLIAYHYFRVDPYLGLDFGAWPTAEADKQLSNLKYMLAHKTFAAVAVDIEAYKNQQTGAVIMPNWISETAKVFCGRLKDWLNATYPTRDIPVLIYTADWFVNSYAQDMNNWMMKYGLWAAQYPYTSAAVTTTWDAIWTTLLPADTVKVKTMSCDTWRFWQHTGDKFIVPGIKNENGVARTICLDMYNGSKEQMYAYLGYVSHSGTVPPIEPPVVPPVVDGDLQKQINDLKSVVTANTADIQKVKQGLKTLSDTI